MISESTGTQGFAFLITAAGSGTRMGGGIKKEFRHLNGKPILAITLKNFIDSSIFHYGVITCKPGSCSEVEDLLTECIQASNMGRIKLLFCDGGAERQESVKLGLECLNENFPELSSKGWVLIHDGARPWANSELIKSVAEGCIKHGACAPITASVDAMKVVNEDGIITGHLARRETVGVQTPQGFSFNEILKAHNRAAADGRNYIDDTEIFSRYEGDVYTVNGYTANKKITYAEDLTENTTNGAK